jgi:hypothetical protein
LLGRQTASAVDDRQLVADKLPAVQQLEKFGTQFHGARFYQKVDIGPICEQTPANLSGVDLPPPTLSEVYLRNQM